MAEEEFTPRFKFPLIIGSRIVAPKLINDFLFLIDTFLPESLPTQGATKIGVTMIAAAPIVAGQIVTRSGFPASSDNLAHASHVVGIAASVAAVGQEFVTLIFGEVPFPGFLADTVLWLGLNGAMTEILPTSGFQLRVGLALTGESVLFTLGEPLILS